jgi:rhomboid family GlyGly-CTERM serine protease
VIPGYSQWRSRGTVFVPWASLLLSSLALFAYLHTGAAPVDWVFDRTAIAQGEWWRLLTGHWVHSDDSHALWNIAALVLLGLASEKSLGNWMPVALFMATAAVDAWLWWGAPHLQQYCGLSGILSGLLAAALAGQWRLYRHPLILLIGAGALVKIALEVMSGQAIFTQTAWPSVPESHAVGLLGGLVVAAAQTIRCRSHLRLSVKGARQ